MSKTRANKDHELEGSNIVGVSNIMNNKPRRSERLERKEQRDRNDKETNYWQTTNKDV